MKIILFYDNFVRDYCGLLLLSEILKGYRHEVLLCPLWDEAIKKIDEELPDVIVMGHVAEYTTSVIADHILKRGIRLVLNSTESGGNDKMMKDFFRYNFRECNEDYMDFQVLANNSEHDYILNSDEITKKDKYKWFGFPRYDFHMNANLLNVERDIITGKYKLDQYNRKFLYVSSFIFDGIGDQVSPENLDDIDQSFKEKLDNTERKFTEDILFKLAENFKETNDVLIIKKHPWEKSEIWEERIKGKSNIIILDNDERISPVLSVTDYMMYLRSISALDAWCQGVRTISIFPENEESRTLFFHHINYDVVVSDYDGLIDAIDNYPQPVPGKEYMDKYFKPYLDGKATIRLAMEINKLEPGNVSHKSRGTGNSNHIKKNYDLSGIDRNSYTYNFMLWETKRNEVDRLYIPAIQSYIKENLPEFSDAEFTSDISHSEIFLSQKGENLFLQGDSSGAKEIFSKVIEMDNSFEPALNNLGVIYWEEGDIENAVKYFRNALEINPFNRETVLNISRVLISLGEFSTTEKLIQSYLTRNPKDIEISGLLEDSGNIRLAEKTTTDSGIPYATGDLKQIVATNNDLSNLRTIAQQNRFGNWQVNMSGFSMYCHDLLSFYMAAKDIFLQGIYDFETTNRQPVVIDGGGNIGLFTLFVKQKYPDSLITVFEPDEESLGLLRNNIEVNGIENVKIVNAGLYAHEGEVSFGSDHSDGSSIFAKEKETTIKVVPLSKYIDSEIDFLKLNIEGAELEVLHEIESRLPLIKEIVIEYHGFPEIGQKLHEILAILDRNGFRYTIHDFDAETNAATKPPFRLDKDTRFFLLIYAKRLSDSKEISPDVSTTAASTSVEPVSRLFGFDRGTPIDRYYIEGFLDRNRHCIQGRVLEIGDNGYTIKYGTGVTHSDVLNAVPSQNATIVGDLASGKNIPEDLFDCIIMTQTIQCIYDVKSALRNAVSALKPGGTLLITASGISQISRYDMDRWGEFWRFTDRSLKQILSGIVSQENIQVESFGNVAVAKAFLDGLALEELTNDILDYYDKDYQVVLTSVVRKPEMKKTGKCTEAKDIRDNKILKSPTVFLYHRVADDPINSQLLAVSPEYFEAHLKEISKNFRVLPLWDLLKETSKGNFIPDTVALTFDDGYLDVLNHGVPLLEKYGVHATVFITSGMIGSEYEFWWDSLERIFLTGNHLPDALEITVSDEIKKWNLTDARQRLKAYDDIANILRINPPEEISIFINKLLEWAGMDQTGRPTHRVVNNEQLLQLSSSPSIEIGSHTVNHAWLSSLSPDAQREEITKSREQIENIIQKPVRLFSYPFGSAGSFTEESMRIVREAGYDAGIANIQGSISESQDIYSVPRVLVRDWTGRVFADWIREEDKDILEQETMSQREGKLISLDRPKVLLWTLWRSGTHWLADMLSDMMGVPWNYYHDEGMDYKEETIYQINSCSDESILVRHICLSPDALFKHTDLSGIKVIFLYRDPRDILASSVNMRKYKEGARIGMPPFSDMSISEILKWEIETYGELYRDDVPEWADVEHGSLLKIRYEDLSKDPVSCLLIISEMLGLDINRSRLEEIAEKHDFRARAKRNKGDENKKDHNRKGIIGDYQHQFSPDEQKMIHNILGDSLARMGYS